MSPKLQKAINILPPRRPQKDKNNLQIFSITQKHIPKSKKEKKKKIKKTK
jgi:hypothetical protein